MATKISPVTLVALAKFYTKASADSKIKPGSHTIDEEVSLRVIGTIDVKPDTEAKPPLRIPVAHVLAVLLGNIEHSFPRLLAKAYKQGQKARVDDFDEEESKLVISEALREDIVQALKTCVTQPTRIEKNYPEELVVTKDMVIEAEDFHKENADSKPRRGAKSFHGKVTVVN